MSWFLGPFDNQEMEPPPSRAELLKRLHAARGNARAGIPKAQAAYAPVNTDKLTTRMVDAYKNGTMSSTMKARLETLEEELKTCGNDVDVWLRGKKGVRPEFVAPIKAAIDKLGTSGSLEESLTHLSEALPRAATK